MQSAQYTEAVPPLQAFELRFKEYLQRGPQGAAGAGAAPAATATTAAAPSGAQAPPPAPINYTSVKDK